MSETGEKIIAKIREIAAASPDFVYKKPEGNRFCVYVHDGEPSCIVGQALWALGLITADIENDAAKLDRWDSQPNTTGSIELMKYLGLVVSAEEASWIREAQLRQDAGDAWADSVKSADLFIPELVPA